MAQKILLVDDEPAILKILGNVFSDEGYSIAATSTGEAGIEKAKEFNPDLVILDVMLPGMNGFEVCRVLKEDDKTKHIAILMLTGISILAEHKKKALDLGADDYMTKPFDMEDLINRAKVLLGRQEKNEKDN
ncbi:MAG: response regulator [Elusimicrobia bacterium]|nr:response regulator [Elusimicrobiota bacterium]